MSDPIAASTGLDIAADPGVQEAAQGLADQLDGQPGAPPAAAPQPIPERPAGPPQPSRAERFSRFRVGAQERYRQDRMRNSEFQRLRGEYDTRLQGTNQLLQQAIEALRARGVVEPQEEIPDPVTDAAAFAKWLADKGNGNVQEALKPVMAAIQKQEERFAAIEQQRAAEAEQQQHVQGLERQYLAWEADYQRASPDLAEGARDRFSVGMDLFSKALQLNGHSPEEASQRAMLHLHAIANDAAAQDGNGVAAIDGFLYGLMEQFWGYISEVLSLDGIQIPSFDGAVGGGAPAGGNGFKPAAPAGPPTEIQRLAAVQQRSAPAGNAAPRVVGRQPTATSELRELWNGGTRDHKQLQAAALRESRGNMSKAQELLGQLIDEAF